MEERAREGQGAAPARWGLGPTMLVWIVFGSLALWIYAPAFDGPLFSDDIHYVSGNPYVRHLSWRRALELFDPRAEAVTLVGNYAPVHLLLHGLEWKAFGRDVAGYHVVNAVLHALNAALLVSLLGRTGVPALGALGGGLVFLLHPANVEAVAWISQLKTVSSLLLTLIALLVFERRPALGTLAFVLALLAKATAALALPVAAVWLWVRQRPGGGEVRSGRHAAWLGLWAAVAVAFAVVELGAFRGGSLSVTPVDPDPWVRLRTSVALGMRYLVMAASSYGVSAYHEPAPAHAWLDPWWLAGLGALTVLGLRGVSALRRRSEEAVWWLWAAAAFLPVSQVLPFRFPMGDRYLYPILPGLIGGVLLAAGGWIARSAERGLWLRRALVALPAIGIVLLGVRSHGRAALWAEPPRLLADAAEHYPDGIAAHLLRSREAAQKGDAQGAVAALRAAFERGFDRFDHVMGDKAMARLRNDPGYRAVLEDMAARWVERVGALEDPSQSELYTLAMAHRLRGEIDQARWALEQALAHGGPLDATIRQALRVLPAPRSE